jgi:hypothetical protein
MSRVLLFDCSPRNPATGAVVPLRLAWNAPGAAAYLGQQWEPVVDVPPSFESAIGFNGREFGAQPSAQVGQLAFALSPRTRIAAGLIWKNAAVTIRSADWPPGGGNPADAAFAVIWTGQADDIAASAADGFARLTLFDGGQALRVPLAILKFGSSGDALLDSADAVKDRSAETIVPLAFGVCRSVPGLFVDRLNNIWLFAARPATAVAGFFDGGAAFTLGTARASLAALIANVPAAGAVDYCLDSAGKLLARPWAEPVYPFTADATFGAARAGDIASAMVGLRTGMAFAAGTIAAYNTAQPADNGIYVSDAASVAELLDRLFRGLGTAWKVRSDGTIAIRQMGFAAPVLTVPNHRMGAAQRGKIVVPTARRTIGYAGNNRVHSEGEIAQALLAGDIIYADGTPVEALKPADAGADVTAAQQVSVASVAVQVYAADYLGTLIGSLSPISVLVTRGGVSIKTDNAVSYVFTPSGGLAATVNNTTGSATKGDITPSSLTSNYATGDLVVSVNGLAQPKQVVVFTRTLGAPPALGSVGSKSASDSALRSLTATTFTPISSVLTVTTTASESLYGSGSIDYEISGTTTAFRTATMKWQFSVAGANSYSDFTGGSVTGSFAGSGRIEGGEFIDPVIGNIAATQTRTTPGAGNWDVRLVAQQNASGRTMYFTGTALVQARV